MEERKNAGKDGGRIEGRGGKMAGGWKEEGKNARKDNGRMEGRGKKRGKRWREDRKRGELAERGGETQEKMA